MNTDTNTTCDICQISCKTEGYHELVLYKYSNNYDINDFYLYLPIKIFPPKKYQHIFGGAVLDTSIRIKPYGLKIKIGETGDFPSSKLKSKVLGSGDIHAYFVKDVVFRKIKKDFEKASIQIEDSEIRNLMEKALLRAKEDFKK